MRRARDGNERLWKIWWLLGIPVGWAMSALALGSEALRSAGYHGSGDVVDVVKLLFYTFWFQLAWRCSHNVETWVWTPASRFALSAGFVAVVMF